MAAALHAAFLIDVADHAPQVLGLKLRSGEPEEGYRLLVVERFSEVVRRARGTRVPL